MAFPVGWNRKCSITIDNTKVSGSANHTDFPVLITEDNLPSEIFDADGSYPANSDGGDIRFTSDAAGTTELAREIVEFTTDNNPANGTAQIWVKVPTLDYNDDTVIYAWYNNSSATEPAAASTYGSQAVWDSNYKGVWHLEGLTDATSNANTLTNNNSATFVAGKIGNEVDLEDTSSQSLSIADNASLSITGDITMQAWVNTESALGSGDLNVIMSKYGTTAGTQDYYLVYYNDTVNDTLRVYFADTAVATVYKQEQTLSTGTDYLVHAVIDVSVPSVEFFVNGSSIGGDMVQNTATSIQDSAEPFRIGARASGSYWDGTIDESRISNIKRSGDWIATEYNNQNSPSTFASAGTPAPTQITADLSDTLSLSDSVSAAATLNTSVSDTTSITDLLSASKAMAVLVQSTTNIVDALTSSTAYNLVVSSIVSITDAITSRKGWEQRTKPTTTFTKRTKPSSTWTKRTKLSSTWTKRTKP